MVTRNGLTAYFHFCFYNQESWENNPINIAKEKKLGREGEVEWSQISQRKGTQEHVHVTPFIWVKSSSCRASRHCGMVIALVFMAHFPWVIQITGILLAHLYIWHLYKRLKILIFWEHWNPKGWRDYKTEQKFKSMSSYFFTVFTYAVYLWCFINLKKEKLHGSVCVWVYACVCMCVWECVCVCVCWIPFGMTFFPSTYE